MVIIFVKTRSHFRRFLTLLHFGFSGRMIVNINESSGGIFIKIMKTNPKNPIHNIRFILPGFEARHELFPFYPPFLENKIRFSEFRFMDFFNTNGHFVSTVVDPEGGGGQGPRPLWKITKL